MFYKRTRKRGLFNTDDCLIEVTTWADLTVLYLLYALDISYIPIKLKPELARASMTISDGVVISNSK
jgi:hypothetical protein